MAGMNTHPHLLSSTKTDSTSQQDNSLTASSANFSQELQVSTVNEELFFVVEIKIVCLFVCNVIIFLVLLLFFEIGDVIIGDGFGVPILIFVYFVVRFFNVNFG